MNYPSVRSPFGLILILVSSCFSFTSHARVEEHEMEQERLSGYREQVVETQIFDRERLRSYRAYLESLEKELFDKNKALREFKVAQKKQEKKEDESNSFEIFVKEKNEELREAETARLEYKRNRKKSQAIESQRDFSEEEELGIYVERPRYDYKKRALYGAKPKYKIAVSKSGGAAAPYSPPDFGTDSGYIPPPPPPPIPEMPNDQFFDEIPPPPPPPPIMPGDFNNGGEFGDGYIPPPPPPPPMFDGEF